MLKQGPLFESSLREEEFFNLCAKLKCYKPECAWNMFHSIDPNYTENSDRFEDEVVEFSISEQLHLTHDIVLVQDDKRNLLNKKQLKNETDVLNQEKFPIEKELVLKLKELLLTIKEGSSFDQSLNVFSFLSHMPSYHVPTLCEMLDIISLNDAAIALFLSSFLQLGKPVSLSTATALALHVVYPKIQLLTSKITRTLQTAILKFSEMYPKAVTDEVIVKCLTEQSLDNVQLDLVLKIIENYLPIEQTPHCIKIVLRSESLPESMFSTLQCLIKKKVPLTTTFHDDLSCMLEKWNAKYNNDLNFTRMLISILTTYGNELSVKQLALYQEIIKNNTTVLKRGAENLLKKLQQK